MQRTPTTRRPIAAVARFTITTPGTKLVIQHDTRCPAFVSNDEHDCLCDAIYRIVRADGKAVR